MLYDGEILQLIQPVIPTKAVFKVDGKIHKQKVHLWASISRFDGSREISGMGLNDGIPELFESNDDFVGYEEGEK